MTDGQLLSEFARTRSESAFAELLRRHGRMVQAVCLRVTGSSDLADDAAQAVFLVLASKANSFSGASQVGGWLHKVSHDLARNLLQAESRRRNHEREAAKMRRPSIGFGTAEGAELLERLDAELARLNETQRQVLVGLYLEGLTQSELARILGVPEGTIAWRSRTALEKLRGRLSSGCTALKVDTVAAVLRAAPSPVGMPSWSESLPARASSFDVNGAACAGFEKVQSLAAGMVKKMIWIRIRTIAGIAAMIAALTCGAELAIWRGMASEDPSRARPRAEPSGEEVRPEGKGQETAAMITPRSCDAWEVFADQLFRHGVRVSMLGQKRALLVPEALRFQPVTAKSLVEAVAALGGFGVQWRWGGRRAILALGAADDEIDRLKKDLASGLPAARQDAAWRAGWLEDCRVLPLLVDSARMDSDPETVFEALRSLRRLGWEAALIMEDAAWPLFAKECESPNALHRFLAGKALACAGGPRSFALLKRLAEDEDADIRGHAVESLGREGGALAAPVLEGMLEGKRLDYYLARAIGDMPPEFAAPLIDKFLAKAGQEEALRNYAVEVLGKACGEQALARLEQWAQGPDLALRCAAITGLGGTGSEKAIPLLAKALVDPEIQVRECALMGS